MLDESLVFPTGKARVVSTPSPCFIQLHKGKVEDLVSKVTQTTLIQKHLNLLTYIYIPDRVTYLHLAKQV